MRFLESHHTCLGKQRKAPASHLLLNSRFTGQVFSGLSTFSYSETPTFETLSLSYFLSYPPPLSLLSSPKLSCLDMTSNFSLLIPSKPISCFTESTMTAVPIAMKSNFESTDKLTELLWQDALGNLQSTNNEVLLPVNITDMIGQCNVDKIKARLG